MQTSRVLVNHTSNLVRFDDLGYPVQVLPWAGLEGPSVQHFCFAILDLSTENSATRRRMDRLVHTNALKAVPLAQIDKMHQHYLVVVTDKGAEPLSTLPPNQCGRIKIDWLVGRFSQLKADVPAKPAVNKTVTVTLPPEENPVAPVPVPPENDGAGDAQPEVPLMPRAPGRPGPKTYNKPPKG